MTPIPPATDEELGEVRRLLEKAQGLPWTLFDLGNTLEIQNRDRDTHRPIVHWSGFDAAHGHHARKRARAELIVAAINALPRILSRLESEMERREAAEQVAATYEDALAEAEAIFGGEYADHYGHMFELAMKAREARRAHFATHTPEGAES